MKIKHLTVCLSILALFSLNCSQKPALSTYPPDESPGDKFLEKKTDVELENCTGRGTLLSQGQYKARLNFTFYSNGDSSKMTFNDLLGRRILEITSARGTIQIRDIIKNRIVHEDEILASFPALSWMNAESLFSILWGFTPEVPDTLPGQAKWNGELKFEHENTQFGTRIKMVSYSSDNGVDQVRLEFRSREFKRSGIAESVEILQPAERE